MADNAVELTPIVKAESSSREATAYHVRRKTDSNHRFSSRSNSYYQYKQLHEWWQELTAIAISFVSFLAIIVTLYPHDGQPLPRWPYSITVNSLISIYVVIFKITILFVVTEALSQLKWHWYKRQRPLADVDIFDQASRGPWGSLKLLWLIAPRNALAGTGAIVAILMVIVDPFAQQILAYHDCDWPVSHSQASVVRTSFLEDLGPDSFHVGALTNSVPAVWREAVYAGSLGLKSTLQTQCPSGNCTMPEIYGTLGFCSSCSDISDQVRITNQSFSTTTSYNNETHTYDWWAINSSLPSGLEALNAEPLNPVNWTVVGITSDSNGEVVVQVMLPMAPFNAFQEVFDYHNQSCITGETKDEWRCRGYGAAQCYLQPCVKQLKGNITVGSLNEVLVDEYTGPWGFTEWLIVAAVDMQCVTAQERSMLEAQGYTIAANQSWLPYNVSTSFGTKVAQDDPFPGPLEARCVYAWSEIIEQSLWVALGQEVFQGKVTGWWGPETDSDNLSGPPVLQELFNWGNISFEHISGIFANISDAMTVVARQSGNANYSEPAIGVVTHTQTCLKVRWAWLSFLAILAVIAWSFFVGVLITQLRIGWIPTWKSSALPMLLRVFVPDEEPKVGAPIPQDRIRDLSEVAERAKVRIGGLSTGIHLVET